MTRHDYLDKLDANLSGRVSDIQTHYQDMSTGYSAPKAEDYTYPAARQAFARYGKGYADYIESHTADLVAKGLYHVAEQSLGERLAGNDGV